MFKRPNKLKPTDDSLTLKKSALINEILTVFFNAFDYLKEYNS